MLSSETRPVESFETDANGLPRWVMCHWPGEGPNPERVLLLEVRSPTWATVWWAGRTASVHPDNLSEEIPPETAPRRLPNDGAMSFNVLDLQRAGTPG